MVGSGAPGKDLVAGVHAVQGESGGEAEIERGFDDFGLILQVPEHPVKFPDHDSVRSGIVGNNAIKKTPFFFEGGRYHGWFSGFAKG